MFCWLLLSYRRMNPGYRENLSPTSAENLGLWTLSVPAACHRVRTGSLVGSVGEWQLGAGGWRVRRLWGPTWPVQVWGVVVASQAIKSRQPSSRDLGVGLRPGRDRVLLIYEPLWSLVNKNKTAGVITNSLLTGSIIYERQEEVLRARGFFGIPTRPELGWCGEDPAWGAPTAFSCPGLMHCPLGGGRKGLGGRCRELEKQSTTSVTSIYTSSYFKRSPYWWYTGCNCPSLCVCAHNPACIYALTCIDSINISKGKSTHIYSPHHLLFPSTAATVTKQAKNSAHIKIRYVACINSHWITIFSPTMAHFERAWCSSENQS